MDGVCLHGDVDGARRSSVLTDFRNARGGVLVATDVAARGVDVKGVAMSSGQLRRAVVHGPVRPQGGRTARAVAGDADVSYGEAHTLLCRGSRDDEAFSKQLVNSLRGSARSPPDADLYKFAKMKPIGASVSTAAPAAFSRPHECGAGARRNPLFAPPPATTAFAPPPTYAAPPPPMRRSAAAAAAA